MPKGHSLLEPRIAALERRVAEMEEQLEDYKYNPANQPMPPMELYEPLFKQWPGNGGS
jgi:hypothetical protein